MQKTYVITGATSFLGARLARHLVALNQRVVAVCRNREKADELFGLQHNIRCVITELPLYANLYQTIDKADVFIHLAWGGTDHQGRNDAATQQANVAYTEAAMRAARRMGCRLFVESGSQAEYGMQNETVDETSPCQPFSEYGNAKLAACKRGFALAEELGMKYLHLRIFSLYGEDDHRWTLVMSSLAHMLANEPIDLSPCTQHWNFLYIADAVEQITRLCEYALQATGYVHEIFNIASDDTRPLRSFVEQMRQLARSESELNYGAVQPAQLVSLMPSVEKLRKTIGFVSPTSFDEAIPRIIKKLRES